MTALDPGAPRPASGPQRRQRPSVESALIAEYRLLLRSIATRGRLVAIGALAALSFLTAVLVRAAGPDDALLAGVAFVNGNIGTLIPLAVLVFGAAALGDPLEDGSLVYLWLRPVPTWVHVVAAWAATVTVVIPMVLVPVMVATTLIDSSADLLRAALLGGLVAIVAYAGLFVMAGIRFKRSLPWGIVYILIWEGFVANAGETATRLAIRSYVRSILVSITGVEIDLGIFSLGVGIVVPLVATVAALAYATRRLNRTDIP